MRKIDALRQTLLQSGLDIQPEDIITRVTDGILFHYYRHPDAVSPHAVQSGAPVRTANDKLLFKYTAELLIMDYGGAPEAVFHLVARWLSEWQPGHKPDCIKIKAEILDNNTVDLLLTIADLTDTYNPVDEADGTRIHNCPPTHLDRQAYP